MALALSLGRRGQGNVWPNPAVGCVIVNAGRIIGRGWTQPGGRPHAETMALAQAGDAAVDATAYVTLEPCAHHGKTPPCAEALVRAGITRVVVATGDNDARVDGRGLSLLQAAGITVETGLLAEEARADHAGFFTRNAEDRPSLTLKLASSFDGRIATRSGESQWITDAPARRLTHAMRARHDAVMVGGGTARKDDPSLNVRGLGIAHQPTRVVVSRRLDLPLMSKLARSARDIPLILCHGPDADGPLKRTWADLGAILLPCALRENQIDPQDLMRQLAGHGLTRIFCEGGGALAASLISADLVDRLVGFTAGLVIGAEGRPGIAATGLQHLSAAPRYELDETRRVGPDVLHVWQRR
ncbi:bifunctional diaminohydroxyphosphoribosylaminopyrimidine deaminase/5-amino-6-(5-phosphoribosylamino)uracil reductase RibD [Sulfitobacter aestuarii]|uniref:Riboflavin biosynthesis protein RibD n=1 Tax=Sulfitobacter aestuarii TaxID=2161676 RepID=A0ABW5TXT0_9RHOB